jgi:site-specific DNA recombinase
MTQVVATSQQEKGPFLVSCAALDRQTSMATRAIAYLRVSTDKQADRGVSLEAQRKKVAAYAELYDLEIVEVIEDAGASAKTMARPGLQRALAGLSEGRADALLVVKLDRLTRSVRDLGELVERYFGAGKSALLSVSEHVDTRSAAGRLVLNVLASVSQWEREEIGDRTRVAMAHMKQRGDRLGRPRFGWRVVSRPHRDHPGQVERHLAEVPEEQAVIATARALRAEGYLVREIVGTLASRGLHGRKGPLGATQVQAMLRTP